MHFDLDAIGTAVWLLTAAAVFVASYRRSRCLSGYPQWKSVLVGLVSASFIVLWLIVWWVNRVRIRDEWERWRQDRLLAVEATTS